MRKSILFLPRNQPEFIMDITEYIITNAEGSIDIIKHLINSLPTDQLIELRDNTTNDELWYYINKQINPQPAHEKPRK